MKLTDVEMRLFEELQHFGTPLDGIFLQEARAACQGLEITQTGNCAENILYSQASGGMGVMVSLEIKNVSNHVVPIKAIRLEIPGLDADFHWLRRLSSKEVHRYGGYVLPACGSCAFDPSVVLNDRFVRDLKLFPGERFEGLLLGEGNASVPDDYKDRTLIPVLLVTYVGRGESYRTW